MPLSHDELMDKVERLTAALEALLQQPTAAPAPQPYFLPDRLPAACHQPRKFGSSLPEVLCRAWEHQVRITGRGKNEVLADALLVGLSPEAITGAIQEMLADARRMWTLTAEAEQTGWLPKSHASADSTAPLPSAAPVSLGDKGPAAGEERHARQ